MRDYGIISPRFWIGETGKALRGDQAAQVLAVYLMTSPHSSMTGVYHCPILYMAHETGMDKEGASKTLQRLIDGGFCEYDEASETVFVVRMAAYQISETLNPGDKRVIGLKRDLQKMPEGRIKSRFLEVYGSAFHLLDEVKKPSTFQAPSKPLRSQDQDQDQDQEQKETSCAEQQADSAPPVNAVITLPTNTGEEYPVTQEFIDEMQGLYPAVDALEQLRKIRGWLMTNPKKRKTKAGMARFVNTWLGKEQDRGGSRATPVTGPQGDDYNAWRKVGADRGIHPRANEDNRAYVRRVQQEVAA